MKSLRLTKQLRENILASFVAKYKAANPEPIEPKSERELSYTLAEKIHQKVYGKYVGLVPDDLFNTCSYIKVQMPNESIRDLSFTTNAQGSSYRISTRDRKVGYVLTSDDPLYVEYTALMDSRKSDKEVYEDYCKKLSKFREDVSQVLESVNTTKQLVEVWPEAEPFLPTEVSNPSSINLPAVNFAEINKVIQ